MIKDNKKESVVIEMVKKVLELESQILNEIPKPSNPEVVEKMAKIFEEIIDNNEN